MDQNINTENTVNVPAITEDDNSNGKYIYPAWCKSDRARSTFRRAIRTGQIKAVVGVNVQQGAEIAFKTKERTQMTQAERNMLNQLRRG